MPLRFSVANSHSATGVDEESIYLGRLERRRRRRDIDADILQHYFKRAALR